MCKIKICGIQTIEDTLIINKYLPDYIGFVFAKSKRKITHKKAKLLKNNLNPKIQRVGVFVNADESEILSLYHEGTISVAQLHGDENNDYISDLKQKTDNKLKIIKAIEINESFDLKKEDYFNADYLLFDNGQGSGKTFDWDLIKEDINKDFFIAGGLNSSNITRAIERFHPYGVDLSSSLETNGYKDESKVREIMELIR